MKAPENLNLEEKDLVQHLGYKDLALLKSNAESALSDPESVGLTFGGGCFFGHGVYVEGGNASFILTNYAVQ